MVEMTGNGQKLEPPLLDAFPRLKRYQEERDYLLGSIVQLLDRDPALKAAWLFGSLGRGNEDALSDLDLLVVVDDAAIDAIIASPKQYAALVGQPLFFIDAPQNAPGGGAYLMACYDAPTAPHLVDWYWQPRSAACIPPDVRLLFDKAGLSHKDQPIAFPGNQTGEKTVERPVHFFSFFWAMLMITAKHACRDPLANEMALLPYLIQQMAKARQFLGQDVLVQVPPHAHPVEKFHLLVQLADEMNTLMEAVAQLSEEAPVAIYPGVTRYLELIEPMLK